MILFTCGECGKDGRLSDESWEEGVECPDCREVVAVFAVHKHPDPAPPQPGDTLGESVWE